MTKRDGYAWKKSKTHSWVGSSFVFPILFHDEAIPETFNASVSSKSRLTQQTDRGIEQKGSRNRKVPNVQENFFFFFSRWNEVICDYSVCQRLNWLAGTVSTTDRDMKFLR